MEEAENWKIIKENKTKKDLLTWAFSRADKPTHSVLLSESASHFLFLLDYPVSNETHIRHFEDKNVWPMSLTQIYIHSLKKYIAIFEIFLIFFYVV